MQTLGKFVALTVVLAGCIEVDDRVDRSQSPILGGTAASVGDYPTVVAIVNNGLCTGTLIAPDLVLTAAHCISPSVLGYSSQSQVTANTTVVLDTTNAYGYSGRRIDCAETIPHSSFSVNSLGDNDIGLIRLAQNVTDRPPTVLNRVHSDAPAGISTTLVGFGMTDPYNQNSAGRLYVLTSKSSVACNSYMGSDNNLLCYDQSDGRGSCSGDSGGPSFANIGGVQKVVGVTSFGDQNCQQYGAYTRVDAELSFVDSNAPELQCVGDGTCVAQCGSGGLPEDPDCADCIADGVCIAECGSGGLPQDPDCPSCVADGDCVEECGSGGLPQDPDCPTCTADGECEAECGVGGLPVDPDCPTCVETEDCGDPDLECVDGACVPIGPAPGELGSECDGNEDCDSGMCAAGPGGTLCSDNCDPAASDCPAGFDCLPAGSGGACWPASGGPDDPDDPNGGSITGGCGVSARGTSVGWLPLVALFFVIACARRRRRS